MSIGEIFELIWGSVRKYLLDIPVFVLAPRRYLAKINDENAVDIAGRLILYSFCFVAFSVAMVAPLDWADTPENTEYGEWALLELLLTLVAFPPFYILAKMARTEFGLKAAIAYVATFKAVYLTIPIFLYGVFLFTEDYMFAFLKGAALLSYLLFFLVQFPVVVGARIRSRFLLLVASFGMFIGAMFLGNTVSRYFPRPDVKVMRFSPLADPVGIEYDSVRRIGDTMDEGISAGDLVKEFRVMVSAARADTNLTVAARGLSGQLRNLRSDIAVSDSLYRVEMDSLSSVKANVRFSTSRALIDLRVGEVSVAQDLIRALRGYMDSPDSSNAVAVLDGEVQFYKVSLKRMEHELGNIEIRRQLRRVGLLYDW